LKAKSQEKLVRSDHEAEMYRFRLFIADKTPRSTLATFNVKKICEENLKGHYELEVIDLYQQPQLAKNDDVLAIPCLLRITPSPMRKIIGDMSNAAKTLAGIYA